jgi:DNA-binding transcriptional MerR regulator
MAELTVKEFAAVERVTPQTVRQWIRKGAVEIRRTPGGGIRILDRRSNVLIVSTREEPAGGSPDM